MLNIVNGNNRNRWNSLYSGGLPITSQFKPSSVPAESWIQNIGAEWYRDHGGAYMAAILSQQFNADTNPSNAVPKYVMVDELRGNTVAIFAEFVEAMKDYRHLDGKWGIYLVNGTNVDYSSFRSIIVDAMKMGAIIAPEYYAYAHHYRDSHPTNVGFRDQWLSDFFTGKGGYGFNNRNRLNYLVDLHRQYGEANGSRIAPLFGVADKFLSSARYPAQFLDRMFYVFKTRTGHSHLLEPHGPGSWVWDNKRVSTSGRDSQFMQSVDWYVRQGRRNSRMGQVQF